MAKFDKEAMKKTRLMVANLKSTGQSKFALDEDEGKVSEPCCFCAETSQFRFKIQSKCDHDAFNSD